MRDLVEQAIQRKVISPDARNLLDQIRHARNTAVHDVEPIAEEGARNVTELARRVLAMVRYPQEIEEENDDEANGT